MLHVWNANHFNSVVPGNLNFSLVGEAFYFIRMLLPLFILYVTNKTDVTEDDLGNVVKTLVGAISGTIVLTNILMISLTSYNNQLVKGSILNWFVNRDYFSFFDLASKGLFYFANTVSAILLLLTPLMWYFVIKRVNTLNVTLLVTLTLSMLMLGTKVAALGFILVSAVFLLLYLVHVFLLKNATLKRSFSLVVLLVAVICGILLPISPSAARSSLNSIVVEKREGKVSKKRENKAEETLKVNLKKANPEQRKVILTKFIKKHHEDYYLATNFVLHKYPYQYDPEFWYGVMQWTVAQRMDNRLLENSMLTRIIGYNNRKLDRVFGISYTRMNNLFNLERDFFSQSYSMGYLGMVLLLGAYVISFIYAGIMWLLKNKYKTLLNSALLTGIGMILLAAAYSGNVMDLLFATFILAFLEGVLLHNIGKIKKLDEDESTKNLDKNPA